VRPAFVTCLPSSQSSPPQNNSPHPFARSPPQPDTLSDTASPPAPETDSTPHNTAAPQSQTAHHTAVPPLWYRGTAPYTPSSSPSCTPAPSYWPFPSRNKACSMLKSSIKTSGYKPEKARLTQIYCISDGCSLENPVF